MNQHLYVTIEGPIGVGKTTLARLIRDEFQAELLLEVFEENPFLGDFYADREKYAFQTQIFFLLSRYRQQHKVVNKVLQQSPLISDYSFIKDRLFAHLNLQNDELATYERLHMALAENIVPPDLMVYLRADTETLMDRIAFRDRSYERQMSRQYIDELRQAYDRLFSDYTQTPLLTISTDDLDIVRNPSDLAQVVHKIRTVLGEGTHQQKLPEMEESHPPAIAGPVEAAQRRLRDFQHWHKSHDQEENLPTDIYFNFLELQGKIGNLAQELGNVWIRQATYYDKVGNKEEALDRAMQESRQGLQSELAECFAYLIRLANQTGIDLEEALLMKIRTGQERPD